MQAREAWIGWTAPQKNDQDDLAAFRLFISQLVVNGSASQGDIRRAFGVPKIAVQRAVDRYRAGGAAAFFGPPQARTGRKLTPEMLAQVQALLDQGQAMPEISRQTGVLANTIHKAIRFGRLRAGAKKDPPARALICTQSQRRVEDQNAPLGCATTRSEERLLAALGLLRTAPVQFECAADVPLGGVLWALPALRPTCTPICKPRRWRCACTRCPAVCRTPPLGTWRKN